MRRHFISEYGDLGAVIGKRKTTHYSYARHPAIRTYLRRGGGGGGEGGVSLELMFQDPSPSAPSPPAEFINNRRVYKQMGVYKHTSHQMKGCIGQVLYMHIEGIIEYTNRITHQQSNRKCDCGRVRTLEPYTTAKQSYAITINS